MMILMPLAYMNPGTGALLLQVIVVGLSAAFVTTRSFWHRFKSFWTRKS